MNSFLTRSRSVLLGTIALSLLGAPLQADTEMFSFTPNAVIPDFNSSGLLDQHTIASAINVLSAVELTLNISGGYNGDYYAYLSHGSGFTILLNRVGRTSGNSFGTTDAGFTNVTFSGSALNDIHNYSSVLNPNGGALSGGVWAVDGRNVDPSGALDTDARAALLSSFNGLDANGGWTLFIADLAPAGQGTLQSWTLTLTGNVSAVPEPATAVGGMLALASLLVMRRGSRCPQRLESERRASARPCP